MILADSPKVGMPADKLVIVRGLAAAAVVPLPPMIGAAQAWLVIRRSLSRTGMPNLLEMTETRVPALDAYLSSNPSHVSQEATSSNHERTAP
jgi:hypothetical protein